MWVSSMTLQYVNYILWVLRIKLGIFFFVHAFWLNLEIWVGLILPAVCARITIHPKSIRRKRCSSNTILCNIINKNIVVEDTHTIEIDTIHYSY
jgi:hypothetical protein